jgi:hypothetical protein
VTAGKDVGGQTARSQLVKNTAYRRSGQTKGAKQPIIHNLYPDVGNDTLWTTKVNVSHSASPDKAPKVFAQVEHPVHNPVNNCI